ncbi:TonB-dependent receptor [Catenovulum sp. SX2]|uniref:TonB-dependent receptor n=1 Tax=Catenovulum sp. SX2 TaxID=3398614 RepID=UPI003F861C74
MNYLAASIALALGFPNFVFAHEGTEQKDKIESIEVVGRQVVLSPDNISSSQGVVSQQEFELRPLSRTGDILEFVPGMVVTQHSGSGKANQYFLRGFNLDHGTDFATSIDGMPVNMVTHGHGQGYTDLNFIIPETIATMTYKKGGYYGEVGDFSGAGSGEFVTVNQAKSEVEATLGDDQYQRFLAIYSGKVTEDSTLVTAAEHQKFTGPWTDVDEDTQKTNFFAKLTSQLSDSQLDISFMYYDNSWNSADQIPSRAVTSGLIDKYGSIDTSVGGQSERVSLNLAWQNDHISFNQYWISSELNLWSNFTYFLDDPINGDQFEQVDKRDIFGGNLTYTEQFNLFGFASEQTFGAQWRFDDIDEVGLYHTKQRQRLGVTRSDKVKQSSISAYWKNKLAWTDRLTSHFAVRYDNHDFEVTDLAGVNRFGYDLSANSGSNSDDLWSFKTSLNFQQSEHLNWHFAIGQGFHSNDARGTSISIDPQSGEAIDKVDPLVRSLGWEAGFSGFLLPEQLSGWHVSAALWALELDSELLFVGDAGNTEVSDASERQGFELTSYYQINPNWQFDFEYAYTDARYQASNDYVPGAIKHVAQTGITAKTEQGWFGSLRVRYFGKRPLEEQGEVNADASTTLNMRLGYETEHWQYHLDLINLTNSSARDIEYFYPSRLTGEADEGVEDIHYHPALPFSARLSVSYKF